MQLLPTRRALSDDGAAIARSLADAESFTAIFDRHFSFVHRYIARRTNPDIADDLAAQTFTLAFAQRDRYHDDLGTARPWLLGIATNLIHEQNRRRARQHDTIERLASAASRRRSDTELDERLDTADCRLSESLAALPEAQRDALLMHVWGDLTYEQIAVTLKVPVGTVRSRISRACGALRAGLQAPTPQLARQRSATCVAEDGNHA